MIRLAGIKDFWVLKRLRIIGIVDSNNFWLFKMTNLFLEATFLVDIWWITGLSKYYLFVEGYDQGIRGEVLGCLGILGNNHVYDCVVDRDSRGGSIMRCLVAKAVRTIKREGFVPKLDCIPGLRVYYEGLGFEAYSHNKNNFKMRYRR